MRSQHNLILREGYPFIAAAGLILLVFAIFDVPSLLTWLWLAVTVFVIAFFRNPTRAIVPGDDVLASPADGEVVAVAEVDDGRYGLGRCRRVSIFMSPFNVHANRVPINGQVIEMRYRPGKFFVASAEKASLDNEQCAMILETARGERLVVVQIAGWLARRIVAYPREGDTLTKGELYGLIRFGSRVDLYVPSSAQLEVVPGDRVFGGSTRMGRLSDGHEARRDS
jgi:phosphatidylserine decarboxylase